MKDDAAETFPFQVNAIEVSVSPRMQRKQAVLDHSPRFMRRKLDGSKVGPIPAQDEFSIVGRKPVTRFPLPLDDLLLQHPRNAAEKSRMPLLVLK